VLYDFLIYNKYDNYHKSIQNMQGVLFPLFPFMIPFLRHHQRKKDRTFNFRLNCILHMIVNIYPLIMFRLIVNLILLPFSYATILYIIAIKKYKNIYLKQIVIPTNVWIVHLISWIFLGPFYLLFTIFVAD